MFRITSLPAGRGDALWIEYGKGDDVHRILVDGGEKEGPEAIRGLLENLDARQRLIDLVVITHIDTDHIQGILELLRDPPPGLKIGDIWFNAWQHLDPGVMGPKQAEQVSEWIGIRGCPWNHAFGGGPVGLGPDGSPVTKTLHGMDLQILGPTRDRLRELKPVWKAEIEKHGLAPGAAGSAWVDVRPDDPGILGDDRIDVAKLAASVSKKDTSEANGSSIVLLASFDGKRALLTGDAFPEDLDAAAKRLSAAEGDFALPVDLLKLSHHGGQKNTSAGLLQSLACKRYLVSSSGVQHAHPNPESIGRILVHGRRLGRPELFFNYQSPASEVWTDPKLRRDHDYVVEYPERTGAGVTVELA